MVPINRQEPCEIPVRRFSNTACYHFANFSKFFRICEKQQALAYVEPAEYATKNSLLLGIEAALLVGERDPEDKNMAIAKPVGKYNWMKIIDIMTKDPLTVAADESIGQADELMSTNNIRQIPVLQATELVGIVTDRDIRSFLSGSLLEGPEAREKALNAKVSEIMTTEPITVSPEEDIEEVVELLIEEKFGGIPVVDKSAGLVGIVTYVDVLRCFLNRLQEDY